MVLVQFPPVRSKAGLLHSFTGDFEVSSCLVLVVPWPLRDAAKIPHAWRFWGFLGVEVWVKNRVFVRYSITRQWANQSGETGAFSASLQDLCEIVPVTERMGRG